MLFVRLHVCVCVCLASQLDLQLLPSNMPVAQVQLFLEAMMRNCTHSRRDLEVSRRLLYLEYVQVGLLVSVKWQCILIDHGAGWCVWGGG